MENPPVVVLYLLLLLLQTLHIFEEIGLGAYLVEGSHALKKYLITAGVLVVINYLPLFLMLLDFRAGYVLGLAGALLGIGNGVVHVAGYVKTRSMRGTMGAGVMSSIPLAAVGLVVLYQLGSNLWNIPIH